MVKKRLGFSDEEFEQLMTMRRHTDLEFETYRVTFRRLRWFFWLMYRLNRIPKSFYIKFAAPETARLTGRALPATTTLPMRTADKDAASNPS